MAKPPPPLVYLIGLGLPSIDAVGADAIEALKRCRSIFVNDDKNPFFRQFDAELETIGTFGSGWQPKTLEDFADKLIDAGLKRGPVALTTYGHPLIFEPLGHYTLGACRKRRVRCAVIAGSSSLDAVLAAAPLSLYGEDSLELTSSMRWSKAPPDPTIPHLILNAAFDPRLYKDVIAHAGKFYPKKHRIAIIEAGRWDQAKVQWVELSKAAALARKLPPYASLLIPALSGRR